MSDSTKHLLRIAASLQSYFTNCRSIAIAFITHWIIKRVFCISLNHHKCICNFWDHGNCFCNLQNHHAVMICSITVIALLILQNHCKHICNLWDHCDHFRDLQNHRNHFWDQQNLCSCFWNLRNHHKHCCDLQKNMSNTSADCTSRASQLSQVELVRRRMLFLETEAEGAKSWRK